MREIKFRAFDKRLNRMWYIDNIFFIREYNPELIDNATLGYTELQQYTGLKDKNGKEIYEGDIIEHTHWRFAVPDITPVSRTTYWNEEITDDWMSMSDVDWVIIGNIYENPELLT